MAGRDDTSFSLIFGALDTVGLDGLAVDGGEDGGDADADAVGCDVSTDAD